MTLSTPLSIAAAMRLTPPRIRVLHWPSLLRSQLAARILEGLRS